MDIQTRFNQVSEKELGSCPKQFNTRMFDLLIVLPVCLLLVSVGCGWELLFKMIVLVGPYFGLLGAGVALFSFCHSIGSKSREPDLFAFCMIVANLVIMSVFYFFQMMCGDYYPPFPIPD